jgi:hypothetical protein
MGRTFICYAHNASDRAVAIRLYRDLLDADHAPWLDKFDLMPGDRWRIRITEVIRECKHFVALLSHHSLNKRGFVQSELREALDVLDTVPVDERFFIPVRLDDCEPKDQRLGQLQWADLFPDYADGLRGLLRTLDAGRRIPGRLYIDVGIEVPSGISTWSDEKLCSYINDVLRPEARERARKDYENIPMRNPEEAVRLRTEEKLAEVATRFGFIDGLKRCLQRASTDSGRKR